MIYYTYKTTNLINGKFYIGKRTSSQYDNWYADPYLGSGTLLLAAIKKYGKHNFVKNIFCYAESNKENCENETLFVADLWKTDDCYNLRPGGEGGSLKGRLGCVHTKQSKQKISKGISKAVLQYSKQGEFIAEYSSGKEASIQTGVSASGISSACIGRLKSSGGFVWCHKM